MQRWAFAVVGVLFVSIGIILTLGLAVVVSQGYPAVLLVLPLPLIMSAMGVIALKLFAYKCVCDEDGITLHFLFRQEQVLWQNVEWYKNVALGWAHIKGGSGVWVLFAYQQTGSDRMRSRKVLLGLEGFGPFVAFSSREYSTVLDKYIPSKSRTRKLASAL